MSEPQPKFTPEELAAKKSDPSNELTPDMQLIMDALTDCGWKFLPVQSGFTVVAKEPDGKLSPSPVPFPNLKVAIGMSMGFVLRCAQFHKEWGYEILQAIDRRAKGIKLQEEKLAADPSAETQAKEIADAFFARMKGPAPVAKPPKADDLPKAA